MTKHYRYNRQIDDYIIEFYSLQERPWLSQEVLASFSETHDSLYEKYPDVVDAMDYLWHCWADRRMLEAIAKRKNLDDDLGVS